MQRLVRVEMLLSDAFGGFGGISRFNRDFLIALDGCPLVERTYALPRIITEPSDETIPESVVYDKKSALGKYRFLIRSFRKRQRKRAELVVCGHLNLLAVAWLIAVANGARLALIVHGIEAWNPTNHILSNWLANRIDAFIAVSRYSAGRFSQWSAVPLERGFILPNCVDLERFKPGIRDPKLVERYALGSDKVILTVGRLASEERYKGFDEVIEVMPQLIQRLHGVRYLIVGDGPDRARLQAKADALGVSKHVVFAGRVAESEKVAHYNLADVYAMPSSGEGFGIVLIEAAACGLPIIGSSADGSRDALLDGRLGRMIDPRRPEELVEAVSAVIQGKTHRVRSDLVQTFGIPQFQARVTDWVTEQVTAIQKMALRSEAGIGPAADLGIRARQ